MVMTTTTRASPFATPRRSNPAPTRRRALALRVHAGAKYKRTDVEVERQIGEGSFGIVYQGKIAKVKKDVVLKRPKLTVEGAAELQEVEAWMNDRVTRDARGSCADFLGSFRVTPDESYLHSSSEGVVAKEGLWLVWRYEGDRTLAQYMAQPDYPAGIAKVMLGKEGNNLRGDASVELEVTQATMRQIFKNLRVVHTAGLIHRDIKPHNLVLTNEDVARGKASDGTSVTEKRFKLIDLGACACFRTGMNFAPDETIMDPKYAPPEEFLIPSDDAPDIRKLFGPVALAAGSAAWVQHKPDRFDMYSAGVVMMQLALPSLRTNNGLMTFNRGLKRVGYDLFLWRDANKSQLKRSQTAVLDAGNGAGWDLARELLRPRAYDEDAATAASAAAEKQRAKKGEDEEGTVLVGGGDRPSAEEALRHRFFDVDPAELAAMVAKQQIDSPIKYGGGLFGDLFGGFKPKPAADAEAAVAETESEVSEVLGDMVGLEKRISKQQELIAVQSTTIMRLKSEGADPATLEKEQRTLEKMRVGLQGLLRAFSFSQVEAKTTMVKAATAMQTVADEAGVDSSPLTGFMNALFGKKATSNAVNAVDKSLDAILDALKPERSASRDEAEAEAEASDASTGDASPAPATDSIRSPAIAAAVESASVNNNNSAKKDPAELRKRMDAIKSEMVVVAEQMAEMERRLMAQQESLEQKQRELEGVDGGGGGEDNFVIERPEERVTKTRPPASASASASRGGGKPKSGFIGSGAVDGDVGASIGSIERTKREIQDALSRIDKMQQDQKDLVE
jgi:serine/threonine protein kinase